MRPPPHGQRKRRRLLSLLPLAAVLVAAGIFVISTRTQAISPVGTPVTLEMALAAYRANPGALRDDIGQTALPVAARPEVGGFTVPKGGVYSYRTTGQDSIIYNGDSYQRPFPPLTHATVHPAGGCVWELYFTPISEHQDAHRQCSAPGEYLCLAHMQKVSFAGIEGDETHRCDPAMIQVGGNATKAGGKEETVCVAHGNRARIVIKYLGQETITVEGVPRPAHRVQIDSFVNGDGLDGSAVADAWFDVEDGLYLKLVRSADVNVDRGGGNKGTYRVEAGYDLVSRTPQV
ncbi:hypothetical protein [Amycolatopsis sp. YIM 10]|uniref:hypothetical protein n=1 Tax=Amycolatopsis sp. YIM 10 TaxID=2653857 RepID=UPI0012AA1616|nr:hypothetical protein [Amycolatopsis sp. YIM 10]QFU90578.1 hypothetical protein YIM_27020 [Amycolatopsis sp. YIM 10]